jgi:hypothetical protein
MTTRRSSKREAHRALSPSGSDGPGRDAALVSRGPKRKPIEIAHFNGMRILNDLWRVERCVRYLISDRDNLAKHGRVAALKPDTTLSSKPDQFTPVLTELNDALNNLISFAHHDEWFERAADACLRSGVPLQNAAARLVLRLKRIGAQAVATYREGNELAFHHFIGGLIPVSRTKNSRAALRFHDACWTRATRILANLATYLASVDLPNLSAEMDTIRLQLAGPFIPSPRQRRLHATLKAHPEGLTKKQLAAAVGEQHPENLYARWGLSELVALGFVSNRPTMGYVAEYDLPTASGSRRRS